MNTSVRWAARVEEYLTYRHRLGFILAHGAGRLRHFAAFAGQQGAKHLTTALATQWARSSKRQTPVTWARRIETLRGFARYCLTLGEAAEIPPAGLFGKAHRRLLPHIFSEDEIATLLSAAQTLLPHQGLRPASCRTLFGLLAATGLRIPEATHLTRAGVDLSLGVLTIRDGKFHKSRLVPLHDSVTDASFTP